MERLYIEHKNLSEISFDSLFLNQKYDSRNEVSHSQQLILKYPSLSLSPDYYMTSTTTFPVMHTLDCVVSSSSSDDTGIFKIFISALKNLRDSDCHQKSASNFSVRLYDENFENSSCKDLNDFDFFTFFANIIVPDRYTSGMNTCCFMRIACSFLNIGHY